MPEKAPSVVPVFLQPAELLFAETPTRVRTILGSCVAITMRVPRLGLASAAHCLLPYAGAPVGKLSRAEALRYVDTTVAVMLGIFAQRGASPGELEIKIFGGADNLDRSKPGSGYRVGGRNVEAALQVLAEHGLAPVSSGVGGRWGRVIEFHTHTGDVFVRLLSSLPDGGREEA